MTSMEYTEIRPESMRRRDDSTLETDSELRKEVNDTYDNGTEKE